MSQTAIAAADDFIRNETQFHLGFLPTEQSNPDTVTLGDDFQTDPVKGVATLQKADRDVLKMAKRVLASKEFAAFFNDGLNTIKNGGRIIFSGCGATGRLSILLESLWRNACNRTPGMENYADGVESIMTGGDFALVRSVEFFEDYITFGRRQAADANIGKNDMLCAISEGGETSSVIGTIYESVERGAKVYFLFNNPADILSEHLERSRKVIQDPGVTVLDLFCCPMALAGSTRMQATTSEQLIAGAMLEQVFLTLNGQQAPDYAAEFEKLLTALELPENREVMAKYIEMEADLYRKHGYVTYFANDCLLDIFTDTTERSPTFMLPPFRKCDDTASPRPWAFVKNPLYTTETTWNYAMRRPLRCLAWTVADYAAMDAADKIQANPPMISSADLLKIPVGNEMVEDRVVTSDDMAILLKTVASDTALEQAFDGAAAKFPRHYRISIGGGDDAEFVLKVPEFPGAFPLMRNMAVKLFFNSVSTGTMARLGRVTGNWMSFVDCTNKKLLDRGTRLLVEIAKVDYRTACATLFEAMEEIAAAGNNNGEEKASPVQVALKKLGK